MLLLVVQALSLYAISWFFWRLVRPSVVRTALDNVPGPPSPSILTGNFKQIFNADAWAFHRDIAEKYGSVIKINTVLGRRQLYVFDPKAMHYIVVKDQHIYEETSQFLVANRLAFGDGLLATLGEHHRKQRKMLNPVFSIAHMRQMVPIFYTIAHKLRSTIVSKVNDGPQEIDMLHWMSRTALELIGQSGLGYSFDSLTEGAPIHPYTKSVKEFIPASFRMFFARSYILPWASKIGPPGFRRFLIDILPWADLHRVRDIVDVIEATSIMIYEGKKKALIDGDEAVSKQISQGKDIMSILMRANMGASKEDRLPESEVLAQVSTLTFAATDTTSGALSRTLYLLANHPEVQEKLRREIVEARAESGDIGYDELVALPYLDAVCREVLRLYPPVSQLQRTTRQDVVLPLSVPIKGVDGTDIREIPIPNNTTVILSILNSNRNPAIWGPDALEFKPERWLSSLPEEVVEAHIPGIYSHLMTFLGGGRACIGFKFSQLEMKVVLSILIEKLRFSLSEKEIFWQMSAIATPVLKGSSDKRPQLPIKVTLAA